MRKTAFTENSDELLGVAAMSEIGSMARIGGFEVGKLYTQGKIRSLKQDAIRARRRGDTLRAEELERRVKQKDVLLKNMIAEQEQEFTRAPVAEDNTIILTGRIINKNQSVDSLRVDLMDAEGKSLVHDLSDEFGNFTLRLANPKSEATRIVISNGKGATIKSEAAPMLKPGQPAYVEIDITDSKAQKPTVPPKDDTPEKLVKVPTVTGLQLKQAAAHLKAEGLRAKYEELEIAGVDAGTVARQSPAAGTEVAIGSTVELLVALKGGVKVPNLTGQRIQALAKTLSEAKLKLGKLELIHEAKNAGKVVDQTPAADTTVAPGSAINLRVASGDDKADLEIAAMLAVNDVRGIDLAFDDRIMMQAFAKAGVTSLAKLDEFAKLPAAEIADHFGIKGRGRATAVRSLLADVVRRFPAG